MKDFGNENAANTICSLCSSRNHHTHSHSRLNEIAPELIDALRMIATRGGNLPDKTLTTRTGPNDAVLRGWMYVDSRVLAKKALEKAGFSDGL